MDPFDKSRCSFPVPQFASKEDEQEWSLSLTGEQRLEILHWMRVARYGEAALNAKMDRTQFKAMTMAEFNAMKDEEDRNEQIWRQEHGWPPLPWMVPPKPSGKGSGK